MTAAGLFQAHLIGLGVAPRWRSPALAHSQLQARIVGTQQRARPALEIVFSWDWRSRQASQWWPRRLGTGNQMSCLDLGQRPSRMMTANLLQALLLSLGVATSCCLLVLDHCELQAPIVRTDSSHLYCWVLVTRLVLAAFGGRPRDPPIGGLALVWLKQPSDKLRFNDNSEQLSKVSQHKMRSPRSRRQLATPVQRLRVAR